MIENSTKAFKMTEASAPKHPRRSGEEEPSLNDLCQSLENMICDDEFLAKIAVSELTTMIHNLSLPIPQKEEKIRDLAENFYQFIASNPQYEAAMPSLAAEELVAIPNHPSQPKPSAGENQTLVKLQKLAGRKLAFSDILLPARTLSTTHHIPLKKHSCQSKSLLLAWFEANWDTLLPSLTADIFSKEGEKSS